MSLSKIDEGNIRVSTDLGLYEVEHLFLHEELLMHLLAYVLTIQLSK